MALIPKSRPRDVQWAGRRDDCTGDGDADGDGEAADDDDGGGTGGSSHPVHMDDLIHYIRLHIFCESPVELVGDLGPSHEGKQAGRSCMYEYVLLGT